MFNCYLHGWSHIEKECPKCFPEYIVTTASTIVLEHLIGVKKSHYDKLLEALTIAKMSLEYISHSDCNDCDSALQAKEDLQKIEEILK